jgi:hypothetical protein
VVVCYINTRNQVADTFTKSHTADRFCILGDKLLVCSLPTNLREGVKDIKDITPGYLISNACSDMLKLVLCCDYPESHGCCYCNPYHYNCNVYIIIMIHTVWPLSQNHLFCIVFQFLPWSHGRDWCLLIATITSNYEWTQVQGCYFNMFSYYNKKSNLYPFRVVVLPSWQLCLITLSIILRSHLCGDTRHLYVFVL